MSLKSDRGQRSEGDGRSTLRTFFSFVLRFFLDLSPQGEVLSSRRRASRASGLRIGCQLTRHLPSMQHGAQRRGRATPVLEVCLQDFDPTLARKREFRAFENFS